MLKKIIAVVFIAGAYVEVNGSDILSSDPSKFICHDDILKDLKAQLVEKNPNINSNKQKEIKITDVEEVLVKEGEECLTREDFYTTSLIFEFLDNINFMAQIFDASITQLNGNKESVKTNIEKLRNDVQKKFEEIYGINEH